MIDFTKPVTTRDGREVRIAATDGPGAYPVVGWIKLHEVGWSEVASWTLSGKSLVGCESANDLINPPPKPVKVGCWLVMTIMDGEQRGDSFDEYRCPKGAEEQARETAARWRDMGRTVHVEYIERELTP